MNWTYDNEAGHYIVKNATIMFTNFRGEQMRFNAAGKRNFKLVVDDKLAEEMESRGINVGVLPARDDLEEPKKLIKINVYADSEIFTIVKGRPCPMDPEEFEVLDQAVRSGHVKRDSVQVEFHVARNGQANGALYLRADAVVVKISRPKLLEEFQFEDDDDDDEIPF